MNEHESRRPARALHGLAAFEARRPALAADPGVRHRPDEVYELAKRRGMDFVTITDHDTIDGALSIAHLPDTFISEELTASFKGEPQAVHVLCYGITPDDHEWLQAHSDDVEACAAYLHEHEITAALAHPFYAVARAAHGAPPAAPGRSCSRSGRRATARAPRNSICRRSCTSRPTGEPPSVGPMTTPESTSAARSPRRPRAATPARVPRAHPRRTRRPPTAQQGSAAKWAHAAMALAIRVARSTARRRARPDPATRPEDRRAGDVRGRGARQGSGGADLGPDDALALLRAWLRRDGARGRRAQAAPAAPGRRAQPRRPLPPRAPDPRAQARRRGPRHRRRTCKTASSTSARSALALFDACLPAIPYAAASAFLGREKLKLTRSDGDRPRVALVADGHRLDARRHAHDPADPRPRRPRVRRRGDRHRRRRRPAARARSPRSMSPSTRGLQIGVPTVPAIVEALAEGRYDIVHVCSPGPGRDRSLAAGPRARAARDRQLPHRARRLRRAAHRAGAARDARATSRCAPSTAHATSCSRPARRATSGWPSWGSPPSGSRAGTAASTSSASTLPTVTRVCCPGEINVLYAGRLSKEKGVELLADAFLEAHRRDPRLHLVLAGGGPEEELLRARLGEHAPRSSAGCPETT